MELVRRPHYRAVNGEGARTGFFHVRLAERPALAADPQEIRSIGSIRRSCGRGWSTRCLSPWFRAARLLRRGDGTTPPHARPSITDFDAVSHADRVSDHTHLTPYSYICGIEGKRIRPLMAHALVGLLALPQAKAVQSIHNAGTTSRIGR